MCQVDLGAGQLTLGNLLLGLVVGQDLQNFSELPLDPRDDSSRIRPGLSEQRRRFLVPRQKFLIRSCDGVALLVKQMSDRMNKPHVLFSINALPGFILGGGEGFELCFPVAQNVSMDSAQTADFPDFVEKLPPRTSHEKPLKAQ